jgi:hypothetical protein
MSRPGWYLKESRELPNRLHFRGMEAGHTSSLRHEFFPSLILQEKQISSNANFCSRNKFLKLHKVLNPHQCTSLGASHRQAAGTPCMKEVDSKIVMNEKLTPIEF